LLGLIVLAIALIVRHIRQPTNDEPVCAKCEYIVHSLPGNICPECGADLSAPGAIRQPRERRPMPRGVLFLIVTIFTACVAIIATPFIVDRLPTFISHYERVDLVPASGAFVTVYMYHLDDGFWPAPVGTVKVVIDPPSRVLAIIEVDPKSMTARYPG